MDQLAFADATTLAHKIRDREISSVELLEHYLARIAKYNKALNAVIQFQVDHALKRAKAADQALAKGECWGKLHGVPITIKESYDIQGLPSTWGSPDFKNNLASEDAVAAQRFQQAGAIIFGKTNVPLHLADFQSYNEVYGTTNNPWDLGRTPGGSSGGSAAALAAGLTGLELGSDIGGSIRNPAHYCGVFGHKPTWGIVPSRGQSLLKTLTIVDIAVGGPLARSARDLKLALEVVAGSDELQKSGWKLELSQPSQTSLADYKIAVWADDEVAPVDSSVKEQILKVAKLVEEAGGQVDYEARPAFASSYSHEKYMLLLHAALAARHPQEVFTRRWEERQKLTQADQSQQASMIRASTQFHREWSENHEARMKLRWQWHEFFKQYDLLLAPISASSAFPHDHSADMDKRVITVNNETQPYFQQLFWAGLTGVAYLPSTVFPAGFDKQGLPIGIQVVGREMADLHTIEFARKISLLLGGFKVPPTYLD